MPEEPLSPRGGLMRQAADAGKGQACLAERLSALARGLRLRLGPGAGQRAERSMGLRLLGRPAAALRALDRGVRLSPREPGLRLRRAECLDLLGRRPQAARERRRAKRLCPELIGRGTGALDSDAVGLRERLYGLAGKAVAGALRAAGPRLGLCGLGLFPPYTITLDVLAALGGSDLVLNNVLEPETTALLSRLGPEVRPLPYDLFNREGGDYRDTRGVERWVRRIVAFLTRGRVVAYATRGHPLVYGGLGVRLLRACERLGIPAEVFGAVSSVEVLCALMALRQEGGAGALQAYESRAFPPSTGFSSRHPLLVYFCDRRLAKPEVEVFAAALAGLYPADRLCRLFGPLYDVAPRAFRARALASEHPEIARGAVLFIPGEADGARRPGPSRSGR